MGLIRGEGGHVGNREAMSSDSEEEHGRLTVLPIINRAKGKGGKD